jgi:MFS family permease
LKPKAASADVIGQPLRLFPVGNYFLGEPAPPLLYRAAKATSPAGRDSNAKDMLTSSSPSSVETRTSWVVATAALLVMAVSFGAPWITVVALKSIAAEVNGERAVPAFAGALVWLGSGFGGILMGRVAERIGVRWTVISGATMIAIGLNLSTLGPSLPLYIGHGLFIGLLGLGGINAPFYVYVSRWFDRRRGSALALISSGSFLAGAIWPPIFERTIAYAGWRHAMLYYAVLEFLIIVPCSAVVFGPPPESADSDVHVSADGDLGTVLGWRPNLVFVLQACAIFTCCVPMSMPQAHLVAFCSDLGISPVHGAAMLSVLLGMAFMSRQVWGAISDRVGGLYTMLAGSACQTVGLALFLATQNEFGLFTVSAMFGFGFSGLVPANILASRELFPVGEAYWRIPTLLLCSGSGMATGGWIGGVLYDYFGYYAPAFAVGVGVSMINFMVISLLAFRRSRTQAVLV